jgi:hypothetical protein
LRSSSPKRWSFSSQSKTDPRQKKARSFERAFSFFIPDSAQLAGVYAP